MAETLTLQITIFLLAAVGFLLKRIHLVSNEGQKNINDLVIYVVLPCNILKAFMVGFDDSMADDLIKMLLLSIGIQVFFVLYSKLVFGRQPEGRRQCLQYATICSNAGFLGNPVAEGVFGSYGLVLASVFLIPMRIMMWSRGLAAFSGTSDKKATLKKVCTHPCVLACILGIVLLVTGFRFPAPITSTITYLGNCNTALSMMVIGMILADITRDKLDFTVLTYSLQRLILLPLIVYFVTLLLPLSDMVRGVAVLLCAMPAGATTGILAKKYEMEPEFATKLVTFSTLLSIPTIWLWSTFLTRGM